MIRFKGELTDGRKSHQVNGEYHLAADNSVRGSLKLRDRIEPGAFALETAGGLTFDIVIAALHSPPSRQGRGFAKQADFEGRLLRAEAAR